MYYIPYALFIKFFDRDFIGKVSGQVAHLETLTWQGFLLHDLMPVAIGNIIGGSIVVATVYGAIYLRQTEL